MAAAENAAPRGARAQGSMRWFAPALIAMVALALAAWTRGIWPDVLVDFGRELYVPWRLAEGDVLYRDVAYFNGPLSPYVNALLFELGGASAQKLFAFDFAILLALIALVFGLIERLTDRWTATVASLLLLALFGFNQLVGIGNYNFLAPYSHEATHGLVLGVATIACIARVGSARWFALAGLCAGLAQLTKPETALAAACAGIVGVLATPAQLALGRRLALFAAGAAAPVAIAILALAAAFPFGDAATFALSAWRGLFASEAAELEFYRRGMGLDRPSENVAALALAAWYWLVLLAPAIVLAFSARRRGWSAPPLALAVFVAYAAGLWFARDRVAWLQAAKPLPLVALAALAIALVVRARTPTSSRAALTIACATLALVALLKMILDARVEHYGFTLALPATAIAIVGALHVVPAWLDRLGARGVLVRVAALVLFAFAAWEHAAITQSFRARKPVDVGRAEDRFRADRRGEFVNAALAAIETRLPPDATLAVLPEGVMINFLARRRNPTPFVNFMPPELVLFGERAILASFEASPPDAIVLAHKDTSEYGFPLFGRDYGQALIAFVRARYQPVETFGDVPLEPTTRFGLQLWLRKP